MCKFLAARFLLSQDCDRIKKNGRRLLRLPDETRKVETASHAIKQNDIRYP